MTLENPLIGLAMAFEKWPEKYKAVFRTFTKRQIKEAHFKYSSEILLEGIEMFSQLDEFEYCQAFKELVDERKYLMSHITAN